MPGCFIGVVGPSGAGKDSLIDAARRHFGDDGPVVFARRVITRPAGAGGEDHVALEADAFQDAAAAGAFALHWQAHGLRYGIPIEVDAAIARGATAVANLSRSVIDDVRHRYENRRIIVVTADTDVLARRLAARGRESAEDIAQRLRRAPYGLPSGEDVVVIGNNGSLEAAESAFIEAVQGVL